MERFGMERKGETQMREEERQKGVTKRESNSMQRSLKSTDRDEEEIWKGGIWRGSKEMWWRKVEGWRVARGIWAGWIKSCESPSSSTRIFARKPRDQMTFMIATPGRAG